MPNRISAVLSTTITLLLIGHQAVAQSDTVQMISGARLEGAVVAVSPLEVTIDYLDAGPKEFRFEYDSADPKRSGLAKQFRPGHRQPITGTGQWVLKHTRDHLEQEGYDVIYGDTASDATPSMMSPSLQNA